MAVPLLFVGVPVLLPPNNELPKPSKSLFKPPKGELRCVIPPWKLERWRGLGCCEEEGPKGLPPRLLPGPPRRLLSSGEPTVPADRVPSGDSEANRRVLLPPRSDCGVLLLRE